MTARDWDSFREKLEHEINSCSISIDAQGYRVDAKKGKPEGIRDHCCPETKDNPRLKSCDYFYLHEQKFFCIEFSDLHRQYIDRDAKFQKINGLANRLLIEQLPREDRRELLKEVKGLKVFTQVKRVIQQLRSVPLSKEDEHSFLQGIREAEPLAIILNEIVKKFQDTDLLLKTIYHPECDKICNLPDRAMFRYFFVVWHPHNQTELKELYDNDVLSEIDIGRLFDPIQDNLRDTLRQKSFELLNSEQIFLLPLFMFKTRYCSH